MVKTYGYELAGYAGRRSTKLTEGQATQAIAGRVMSGWEVGHRFVTDRNDETFSVIFFTESGKVWACYYELRSW